MLAFPSVSESLGPALGCAFGDLVVLEVWCKIPCLECMVSQSISISVQIGAIGVA